MVHLVSILADVIPPGMTAEGNVTWWAPLINTGAIGVVLGWFMLRMEPRMRSIEASIDRVSRALMLAVLALRSCDPGLKDQAAAIVKEIDDLHSK